MESVTFTIIEISVKYLGELNVEGKAFHHLPCTSPLKTWLLPAKVASHSIEERSIWDNEITISFISGRNTGSSSTHCFASVANLIE